jgi:hypothetical protein
LTDDPFHVRDKTPYELEARADERNSPIPAAAAARAETARRDQEYATALANDQLGAAQSAARAAKLAA